MERDVELVCWSNLIQNVTTPLSHNKREKKDWIVNIPKSLCQQIASNLFNVALPVIPSQMSWTAVMDYVFFGCSSWTRTRSTLSSLREYTQTTFTQDCKRYFCSKARRVTSAPGTVLHFHQWVAVTYRLLLITSCNT